MKSWVEQYLAIPFKERGRTREGVDCYGLVRLIYQERRGIELPSYDENYATVTDHKEITALLKGEVASNWGEIPISEATTYDGMIFRLAGQPTHFGMVLDPPWFIHAVKRPGQDQGKSFVERWDSMWWQNRFIAAVRWRGV